MENIPGADKNSPATAEASSAPLQKISFLKKLDDLWFKLLDNPKNRELQLLNYFKEILKHKALVLFYMSRFCHNQIAGIFKSDQITPEQTATFDSAISFAGDPKKLTQQLQSLAGFSTAATEKSSYKINSESLRALLAMVPLMRQLLHRALVHDLSKFNPDESGLMSQKIHLKKRTDYTDKKEYQKQLDFIGSSLKEHFKRNSHHPEHHEKGVQGMNWLDLMELLIDWWASSHSNANGNPFKSLASAGKKYEVPAEICEVFWNILYGLVPEEFERYEKFCVAEAEKTKKI
jgi:hypothetical protein